MLDFPTGSVTPYSSPYGNLPTGWAACNGDAYNGTIDDYAPLYKVIGTRFGGTGASSFNVPNLGQRTVLSAVTSIDVGGFKGATTVTLTASTCGIRNHSHAITEIAHAHVVSGQTHGHVTGYSSLSIDYKNTNSSAALYEGSMATPRMNSAVDVNGNSVSINGQNTGYSYMRDTSEANAAVPSSPTTSADTNNATPHNNLMPYLVVQYIIKL